MLCILGLFFTEGCHLRIMISVLLNYHYPRKDPTKTQWHIIIIYLMLGGVGIPWGWVDQGWAWLPRLQDTSWAQVAATWHPFSLDHYVFLITVTETWEGKPPLNKHVSNLCLYCVCWYCIAKANWMGREVFSTHRMGGGDTYLLNNNLTILEVNHNVNRNLKTKLSC